MTTYIQLSENLDTLGLHRMKENLSLYIDMINDGRKDVIEALYELSQQEIAFRREVAVSCCVKTAHFPFLKEMDDFDFEYQPSIDRRKIADFMTLRFLEDKGNIIFCGSPGVGKTHLAVAIGIEAAKQRNSTYFITFHDLICQLRKAKYENRLESRIKWISRYRLLIIDELGYEQMDPDTANLFFNLISNRYERSSTIITTNSPFSRWADIFGEPVLTNALLDRLLHHCSVININGPSYRMKDQIAINGKEKD
ncbi:MAG: IS21-like element helper ATPase IstB [Oscillospiraceae bacterium]|nr:IS21-like element helper ATPase IstB [Oscillospiraceae bacterium]